MLPLAEAFTVRIFATCKDVAQAKQWRADYGHFKGVPLFVHGDDTMPISLQDSRFDARWCDVCTPHQPDKATKPNVEAIAKKFCGWQYTEYWLQYGHLRNSFRLMRVFEIARKMKFDYIVKTRSDITYRPGDVLQPAWLRTLPVTEKLPWPSFVHERKRLPPDASAQTCL